MTARLGAVDREGTLKKAEEIGQVKMPQPVGYKILITLPRIEEKIGEAGNIIA
jgi:hypothetical protein